MRRLIRPHLIVHQSDEVLASMSEWCIQHHGQSGLTAAVRASTISLAEAERQTLEFVARHAPPGVAPLCGNSVDLDRRFLARHMPLLTAHLEDRLVDVSSVKELQRRWRPELVAPKKKDSHRALDDILESIEELRFYRARFFRPVAAERT